MPDRRLQAKSKYTADRNMPGAFEGETVTRRRFMTAVTHGAGGVAAAAFTIPALGFAIGPIASRLPWQWQPVGPPSDFNENVYVTKVIEIVQGIGEAGKTIAYMRLRDPAIDVEPERWYNHYIALSSRCMHLGCPVRYVAPAARFICPCHGGVYNFRGQVAGGPPVRPLDRFFTRLNESTGLVEVGPRYSVNSELQMFSPRDPGEPLDGIGQYLYPPRFDTATFPKGP
jgi:menaquinol-cytochrome c reductase iron-sulfur subunit